MLRLSLFKSFSDFFSGDFIFLSGYLLINNLMLTFSDFGGGGGEDSYEITVT